MHSFKKELIHNFQLLHKVDGLEKNKLIVYTAAGAFIGTPVLKENAEDNDSIKITSSIINNASENYRKSNNIPAEQPLDGNDGCFSLSDAVLITGNVHTNIPIVTIFYDQIIGISFGNID